MTRYCLVLQKCLKLKYFIYSKYKLKHFLNIFSCEDAAQQVLMSVCPSVRVSSSWNSAFYNIQNVQECMQNVPECPRMYAECSRMFQNVPECMKNIQNVLACSRQYAECVRMFQNVCRMHADPWVCLQLHMLACRSMSLHAVSFYVWAAHKNFAVLLFAGSVGKTVSS